MEAPGARRLISPLRSVRGRLILLTLVLVVAAGLVAGFLLVDGAMRQQESTKRQLAGTARALSLAVDGEIGKAEILLRTLASSDALARGDIAALDKQARRALPDPVDMWVVVQDGTGRQLVNTSRPIGAKLPDTPRPDFKARWDRLMREGRVVSGLGHGRLNPGYLVAVNTLTRTADGRFYSVDVLMRPAVIGRLVSRQDLPKGWYGGVIDADGLLIARNVDPEGSVGRKVTPDMLRRMHRAPQDVFKSTALDGAETLAAFNRSDLTGWTVAVAMPRSEAAGYLNRSLALLLSGSLALILVAGSVAFLLGRGAAAAVETVVKAAETLGDSGELGAAPATGLRETDKIAAALYDAAQRLSARESELRALNETLEARVEDAAAKLVQAHKLEAVGRMTGGIAHDFNNLLTAVLGNLHLLGRRIGDDPKLNRYIENASAAAERGARLTGQLLAFSRKQRLEPEPCDINAVLSGMGGLLNSVVTGAVRVETRLAKGLPAALADRTQLELVMLNLAINARDAMPNGGAITISTGERSIEAASGRVELPDVGRYVTITVADDGEGMTPEVQGRVFEPFFTTKPPGQGSGLGLSQCLGILKQLGGGIDMESTPGQGTRVTLLLPHSAQPARPSSVPPQAAAEAARPCRVLLVDDDLQLRETTSALLEEAGCEVVAADGGEAALEALRSGASPAIAIVDYAMPGMNGVQLAARIAELDPDLPVVLSSGFMEADDMVRGWRGPSLPKPYDANQLARLIGELAKAPQLKAAS